MFSTEEFQNWGKSGKAVLFAAVMTKIDGREHDELLRTYGFGGFPSLAILDGDGEMVTNKVDRNLESMAAKAGSAMGYLKMKAAAEAGDADPAEWYLLRLRMGAMDFETASKEREGISFSAEQVAEVANGVFALEMAQLRSTAWGRGSTPEQRAAAEERIYEAYTSGLRLPESAREHPLYIEAVVSKAKEHGNAEAFLDVFPAAVKIFEANIARSESTVERYKATLERGVADNMKERYEQAIEGMEKAAAQQAEQLADLRKTADEMRAKAKSGK